MDDIASRARNLFVISSAIIVYLLAGADLGKVAFGGMTAPADYPQVFKGAAVAAFVWFWWRYFVLWQAKTWRPMIINFRSGLIKKAEIQSWLNFNLRRYDDEAGDWVIDKHLEKPDRMNLGARIEGRTIFIEQVEYAALNEAGAQVRITFDTSLTLTVSWWVYLKAMLAYTPKFILLGEEFSNLLLPHLWAGFAVFLILFTRLGWIEPAGIFGLLTKPSVATPSYPPF